jgi:TonB family protein
MSQISRNVGLALILAFLVVSVSSAALQQQDETVYPVGNGVTEPIPLKNVQPSYTQEARDARVQGTIQLEAVIGSDGSISKVQVLKSLGYGLDENAAKALSEWQFKPGTKDGKPVNVRIQVTMNFSLR